MLTEVEQNTYFSSNCFLSKSKEKHIFISKELLQK